MVKPKGKREIVDYFRQDFGLTLTKACVLAQISAPGYRYKSRRESDDVLRQRMKELAAKRIKAGCPMLHKLLKREKLVVNHKKSERIYNEENLKIRLKQRKKLRSALRVPLPQPTYVGEQWAIDFVSEALWGGRRFRVLNILDVFPRECLASVVDASLGSQRVIRELDRLLALHGKPTTITLDNGPEFTSLAMDEWAWRHGIKLDFIDRGKPQQNAFIESFNGIFRRECLDVNWFSSIFEARRIIEEWRLDYNQVRPHGSLGDSTPDVKGG